MSPPDPNNTYTKPPSENQTLEFIKTLSYDEDPETKMIVVSKMVATRLHQPWRAILSVLNRSLTGKDSKSGKEMLKTVDELEEQHVSPVKSGRGKGFICYGDQAVNFLKKDVVPRKTRSLTIAKEIVIGELANSISIQGPHTRQRQRSQLTIHSQIDDAIGDTYVEWGQELKGHIVEDPTVQSLEYDQKLEALTNFNISEAFEKVVQAKVLIEIKKLLPTYIPKAIANYVRPLLNTSVLDVMKNNQISLFTKPSTTTDDLSEIDLKLRLLNIIHLNKSNETHTTHQQLYDTFYDSITLDQDALNALDAEPSFHKRTYDNQDPPNNREGENRKKRRKDVGEPSSKSSRQKKSPVIHAQDDTPAIQPVDQKDEYIQTRSNSKWYTKSGSTNVVRKTTWFDLLLKLDIEQNENHILRPSTVAIAKKLKSIIKKDELAIADFKGAGLERLKQQYQNDVELEYHVDQLKAVVLSEAKCNSDENDVSKSRMFKRHMSKNTKPCPSFYNNDFDYLVILSTEEKYTTSLTSTMMQDTINKNKVGKDNKRLKGRDWTDNDVMKSNKIMRKIDQTLKRKEQLRRLEEYVGRRPKTVNPRTFVRPM
ncbi:hypothetical protein Tco_0762290 [Tanacetum coccineum]